jgi:hypothetical protein
LQHICPSHIRSFVRALFLWLGRWSLLENQGRFNVLFGLQVAFYVVAALGWGFRRQLVGVPFALWPYFFVSMSAAFLVGFARLLAGRDEVKWQKVT